MRPVSVFADAADKVWKYRFEATIYVDHLVGGVPSDPKVAEGWLRTRILGKEGRDHHLAEMLATTVAERGVDVDTAIKEFAGNVNGFKRDKGGLVLEGRCVKAMIREAFSCALAAGHIPKARGWGATNKGLLGFVAEHAMVPQMLIPILGEDGKQVTEPTGIQQRFVSTFRGQGISYEEFCAPCTLDFEVWADYDFDNEWPVVWAEAEKQGVGSTRSQGFGMFVLSKWDPVVATPKRKPRKIA